MPDLLTPTDITPCNPTSASDEVERLLASLSSRSRTSTVTRPHAVTATTSTELDARTVWRAESADETPSDFGALDFVATDVSSGSEDTTFAIKLRVAGRALDDKYQFRSTAGDGFTAIFTHAVTADRTYTLQDATGTITVSAPKLVTATRDMSTATGTQAITGIGFTPRYVQILAANNDEASRFSVGASDGTNHYCMFGQTTGGTGFTAVDTTKCIHLLDNAGTDFLTSTVQSLDADGLTLSHTKGGSMTGTATFIITAWP